MKEYPKWLPCSAPVIASGLKNFYGIFKYFGFTFSKTFRVFKDDDPTLAVKPGKISQAIVECIPILAEPLGKPERSCGAPEKARFAAKTRQIDSHDNQPDNFSELLDVVWVGCDLSDTGLFGVGKASGCHPDKPLRIIRNVR